MAIDADGLSRKAMLARQARAAWVGENIVPYESRIRGWLRRWHVSPEDADELLQDAYCRIALLENVEHIDRPLSYFFSIVRNLLARRHRRQRIISFELIAEVDAFQDAPANGLEDQMSDRLIYQKIVGLIDGLPPRCREIVRLRKLEDWPQKRIAEHLRISEKTVEAQIRLGLRAIRAAWDRQEAEVKITSGGRYQTGATIR